MANETKLAWFELEASMFPKNVQEALAKATAARKMASEATAAVDTLLQTFAPRIQVPVVDGDKVTGKRALLATGESMVISHRFGKLSVAATLAETKKAKASKVAQLA